MSSNKIAVITGGNRGLGRAGALAVAADGTDVVLTYRSHVDEADAVVDEINQLGRKAVALQLDCGHADTFGDFAARLSATLAATWQRTDFDFLVNNAGLAALTPLGGTDEDVFDRLVDIHFKGVFFLTQTLQPLLTDGGRVLNTSTGLARFTGDPNLSVYAALKGAIDVLTRYWAKALGGRGIRVNTIAPGPIGTDFGGGSLRDNEQIREILASQTALGRVGEPEDIGGLIATMLSEGTRWISGQRVEASGGMLL